MKVFEQINNFFVKYPFLIFIIIIILVLVPLLMHTVNKADEKYQIEKAQKEKQMVCVSTHVIVKPDLDYEIKTCDDKSVTLVSINGQAPEGENK